MNAAVPDGADFIDRYYQDLRLPKTFTTEKKYLHFTIEKKTASELIGMCKTYTSYKNCLQALNAEEDSVDDPIYELKQTILKHGTDTEFDLICPFFCVAAKKTGIRDEDGHAL